MAVAFVSTASNVWAGPAAPPPGGSVVAQTGPIGEPGATAEAVEGSEAEPAPDESVMDPGTPETTADLALAILLTGAAVAAFVSLRRRGVLRKEAFDRLRRDPTIFGPAQWLVGAGGLFLLLPVAAALGAGLLGVDPGAEPESLRARAIPQLAAYAAALVVIGVLLAALGKRGVAAGFRGRLADLILAPAAFLLIFPLVYVAGLVSGLVDAAVRWGFGLPDPDPLAHGTLRLLREHPGDPWAWALIGAAVVGAPIVEEFLYRGFLQSGLLRVTRSGWGAILATSALFAFTHVGIADPRALPGLFALSVAMGVAFEQTGRISIPIGIHALFNGLNIAVVMAGP